MESKLDEKLIKVLENINSPEEFDNILDESELYNIIRQTIFAKDGEKKQYRLLEQDFNEETINEFVEKELDNILQMDRKTLDFEYKNNDSSTLSALGTQSIKVINQYRQKKFFPKNEIKEVETLFQNKKEEISEMILKETQGNFSALEKIENAFDGQFYGISKKLMIRDLDVLPVELLNYEILKYDILGESIEKGIDNNIFDSEMELLNQSASIGSKLKSDFETKNEIKPYDFFIKYNTELLNKKLFDAENLKSK